MRFGSIILLVLLVASSCQKIADRSDQKALIKQCDIPNFAVLAEYDGFPAMSGFGQREGLNIATRFNIPEDKILNFEKSLKEQGSQWQPLPISNKILEKIRFKLPLVNLKATNGFFRCRNAGDNILHAEDTSSCVNPKGWVMVEQDPPKWEKKEVSLDSIDGFSDIIISVYETETGSITAGVASGY